MERARQLVGWNRRSDLTKTIVLIAMVIGITLGGFGVFTVAMGTSSPLVVVTSGSMSPTLERGHLLVLQKQAPESILVGDIIVFDATWNDDPVVHRVVRIEVVGDEIHWFTQGDNRVTNPSEDPGYRVYEDIIGVVILAIPYLGNLTLFLHEPAGLATVVVLLLVIIILPELLPKKDEEEETEDEPSQSPSESDSIED